MRDQLTRVVLRCRDPAGSVERAMWDQDRRALFYAPWLAASAQSDAAVALLMQRIENAPVDHRIALKAGDVLFLDNGRMLHGRDSLDVGSPRWLTRYWIA